MKFTPITIAITGIIGFAAASYLGYGTVLIVSAVFLIVALILSLKNRALQITMILIMLIFVASGSWYAYSSGSTAHKTLNYVNKYVTVSGAVISPAEQSESKEYYRYKIRVTSIDQNGKTENTKDTIMLSTPTLYHCGDGITVRGIIKEFPKQMNEYGFDTAEYYKSLDIFSKMYTKDTEYNEAIRTFTPYMICGKYRERADELIFRYCSGDTAAILSAVLTGNMTHFSDEYEDVLEKTTFKRMLHPAYLHTMLLLMFLGLISGFVHKRWRDLIFCITLLAFALLSSANIGFVRCMLTIAVTIIIRYKMGDVYFPNVLAIITIGYMIFTPMLLFNTSFILSMSASLLMWGFRPYFNQKLYRLPFKLGKTLTVLIIMAFGYTPIAMFCFDNLCIYSFITPIIMTPITAMLIIMVIPSFIMLSIFGSAPVLGGYVKACILIIYKLPYIIERLPFYYNVTGINTGLGRVITVAAIVTVYFLLYKEHKRMLCVASVAAAMLLSTAIYSISKIGTTEAIFVNVGQGDGSVIHTVLGDTIIIDGGGGNAISDYDPGEEIFLPYLTSHGFGHIDAAFISHFHKDHVQGVIAAIKNLKVKDVYAPAQNDRWDDDMVGWKMEVENVAKQTGTEIHYISESTTLDFKHGLKIDITAPDDVIETSDDGNDTSLLMRVSFGDCDILYTGDMTAYAEKEYIRMGARTDAEILKVAHHGSRNSTCEEWVNAVAPEYAVISCGENNSYGHPHEEITERLGEIKILRTDELGDIRIRLRK